MNFKRIGAFFVDWIVTAVIMEIPFMGLVMIPIITGNPPENIVLRAFLSTLIASLYLIFRDLPKNGSIGKRVFKLQIINSETKESATIGQRILRNIPILLSWIEVIVFIASNGKRIGDRIAKTDVILKN